MANESRPAIADWMLNHPKWVLSGILPCHPLRDV